MKYKDIKKDMQSRFQLDADIKAKTIKEKLTFAPARAPQVLEKKTFKWRFAHGYSFLGLLLLFGLGIVIAGGMVDAPQQETQDPTTPPATQIGDAQTAEILFQDMANFLEVMDLFRTNLSARSIDAQSMIMVEYLNTLVLIQQSQAIVLEEWQPPIFGEYERNANNVFYTFSTHEGSLQMDANPLMQQVTWISDLAEDYEAYIQLESGSFYLAKEGNLIRFLIEQEDIYWYVEIDQTGMYETLSYYQENETSQLVRYELMDFQTVSPVLEDPAEIIFPHSEALKGVALP